MEDHEFGYAIFEPLPIMSVSGNKRGHVSSMTVAYIENNYHNNAMVVSW